MQSPCFPPSRAPRTTLSRRAGACIAALVCLLLAFAVAGHAAAHQGATGPAAGVASSDLGDVPVDLHTDDHFGKRRRASLELVQAQRWLADRTPAGHAFVDGACIASLRRNATASVPRPHSAITQRADPAQRLRRSRGPPRCF